MHYILQCGSANSETLGLVEHSAHRDSAKCRSNKTEIRFAAGERVPETVNAFPVPPLPSPCLASSLLYSVFTRAVLLLDDGLVRRGPTRCATTMGAGRALHRHPTLFGRVGCSRLLSAVQATLQSAFWDPCDTWRSGNVKRRRASSKHGWVVGTNERTNERTAGPCLHPIRAD